MSALASVPGVLDLRPAGAPGRGPVEALGLGCRWSWAVASLGAVVAGGAVVEALWVAPEELLFRGAVQGELGRRGVRPWLAVTLAALLFALAHWIRAGTPAAALTFFPGCLFGWLRLRSGSVWPAVAAHALANALWQLAWVGELLPGWGAL